MKEATVGMIKLSDAERKKAEEEIADFYLDVRDEDIGIIEQQQVMDFFMETMAPIIYNRALNDAKNWYAVQQDNLDCDFYALYKDVQ